MNRTHLTFYAAVLLLLDFTAAARLLAQAGGLEYGPYPVGFELIQATDFSRSFPDMDGSGFRGRPMRIYIWYPAQERGGQSLTVGDFVHMAADDFRLSGSSAPALAVNARLPVPLTKGLDEQRRRALMAQLLKSQHGIQAAPGEFPLLVLGQGLYYESPLSQVLLCEYLASRGYIVATCPLLGTRYRLVNRSVEDLETEVRDMESVIAALRSRPNWQIKQLGVIGFDLGGMAGLVLAMRHPEVEAFLSLDCAILFPLLPGLPDSHPSYREDRFTIPWMHMTQARFIEAGRQDSNIRFLSDKKKFGDTWIVSVPSDCHGQFSSYARFGIKGPVPGYWGPVAANVALLHDGICRLSADFFDAMLKKEVRAIETLQAAGTGGPFKVEFKKGAVPPASLQSLLHAINEKGLAAVRPEIDKIKAADPAAKVLEESELNWLAYHFLLWWGRDSEALDLFKLNVELNPGSAEAHSSIGEAYMILGRTEEAIAAFKKSLEISPDQPNVKAALENLTKNK